MRGHLKWGPASVTWGRGGFVARVEEGWTSAAVSVRACPGFHFLFFLFRFFLLEGDGISSGEIDSFTATPLSSREMRLFLGLSRVAGHFLYR